MISRTGKLKHRLVFKYQDGFDRGLNGQKIPKMIETKPVWFGYKQQFINQVINNEGGRFENSITIAIRQKQRFEISSDWIVSIKNTDYKIIKINPDVENDSFMVLFIERID